VDPARTIAESLTSDPGIREHNRHTSPVRRTASLRQNLGVLWTQVSAASPPWRKRGELHTHQVMRTIVLICLRV
jgi:hypothetical protein